MKLAGGGLGALIVAGHAAGFAVLATRCHGTELALEVTAPPASPVVALDARVPAALAGRIAIDDTGAGPGLHHRTWRVRYRGGIERAVGAAQLVGPFQDPGHPACTGRVIVGQRLLDDGRAGPGTIAAAMAAELATELRGESMFPIGAFQRIERLRLGWARLAAHPGDRALVGDAPHGYVRAEATIIFDRVAVPLTVALVPEPSPGALRFRIAAHADLTFDNRAVQWLSDKLGADRLATRLARRQIDDTLITALAPPPPFALAGGQTLQFTYCDDPLEIADAAYGALPFGVAIGTNAADPRILPPRLGPGPRAAPLPATALALDLDLDALNAVLYELWRGGFLDRRLAEAGLHERFNTDLTVTQFLSLRLAAPRLRLPPVITAAAGALRMSAEARIAIHDGGATTTGRVWGGLAFRFAPHAVEPIAVDLDELALSCERAPTTLVPCYDDLVAAMRGRATEFHGVLTRSFTALLSDIFVGRIGAPGLPADLVIRGVIPGITTTSTNATVHFELDAAIFAAHELHSR
ncbi:MAG TPA: hypothetical protein VH165_20430 [Kofleriaceae bacterium]|nr:hypothetical protein [Kofleriaceae bacterium]